MLAEIVKIEQEKTQAWHYKRIQNHLETYHRMVVLKNEIDKLSDGLLNLNIKFAEPTKENLSNSYLPCLEVLNIRGVVHVRGDINNLVVGGLGLFPLMGEKHTVESFFKKIAPYLRTV